ncbi:MAG: hypothetical protein KDA20_06350 [Phycisphaerales bacterium]|nr:hypothetical protein [Phycisphaerales bacterium]
MPSFRPDNPSPATTARSAPGSDESPAGVEPIRLRGMGLREAVIRSWRTPTVLFAIALSVFVHLMMLSVAAAVLFQRPGASAHDGASEIPLAIISESQLTELADVSLADSLTSDSALDDFEQLSFDDLATPAQEELAGLDISELGDVGGAGDVSAEGGAAVFDAGGGAARFFGVEARGSRFAYIADISGSMVGDRIAALQNELVASIRGLLENTTFSVVLYNSNAVPITGTRWMPATDRFKRQAEIDVMAIRASGATNPIPAFERVLAMRPRPDAIYFMTDGKFAPEVEDELVGRILQLNRTGGRQAVIHCITFIEDDSAEIMRAIARATGGTYTHIARRGS